MQQLKSQVLLHQAELSLTVCYLSR